MKKAILMSLSGVLALTLTTSVWAQDTANSAENSTDSGSQSVATGTSGQDATRNPDKGRAGVGEPGTVTEAAGTFDKSGDMDDATKKKAKEALGPTALMMHTSLQGALTEVRGLMAQVEALPADSKKSMESIRTFCTEIGDELKSVSKQQSELQAGVKQYPQLANSSELKSVSTSASDAMTLYQSWSDKAKSQTYWSNKDQAKADLDQLQQRLNSAVDQTKNFSSAKLDLNTSG